MMPERERNKMMSDALGLAVIPLVRTLRTALAASVAGFVLVGATVAVGQEGYTVATRDQGDYAPLGVRAGSFLIFPMMEIMETFDSNVYATEDNERADLITDFMPSLRINSDWNNHAVSIFGAADVGVYMDKGREDFEDYNFGADGQLDIRRNTNVSAAAEFKHQHDARGNPDDAGGSNPTLNDRYIAGIEGYHKINRVSLILSGDFERFDYHDSPIAAGGLSTGQVNNDDRDRNEWEGTLRTECEIVPEYGAFIQGAYNVRAYMDNVDDVGYNRDSDGFKIIGGTQLDFGGVTQGEVFVGYLQQNPTDAGLLTSSGFVFGTHLIWNVTRLTTVDLNIDRNIKETTTAGVSGINATAATIAVEHELRRNIILDMGAGLTNDDYNGGNPAREDNLYTAGAGAKYLVNRNFFL
jgi:hypothetical protein